MPISLSVAKIITGKSAMGIAPLDDKDICYRVGSRLKGRLKDRRKVARLLLL
jgi:hypothetical protein